MPHSLPETAEDKFGWVFFPDFTKAIKEDGTSLWEEKWPLESLLERRRQMGPIAWAQEMENNPVPEENSYFTLAAFEECFDPQLDFEYSYRGSNPVFIGVDSQSNPDPKKASDFGCLFVIEYLPITESRRILWIERGRWGFRIVDKIKEFDARYKPAKIKVENNQAQDYIVQELEKSTAIPVEGFTTGGQKPDIYVGIPYLAATVTTLKWIIPRKSPESKEATDHWISEALEYGQGHSGDTLMASWFANDAARELASLGVPNLPDPDKVTNWDSDFSSNKTGLGDRAQRDFNSPAMSVKLNDMSQSRAVVTPAHSPSWRAPRRFDPARRKFNG